MKRQVYMLLGVSMILFILSSCGINEVSTMQTPLISSSPLVTQTNPLGNNQVDSTRTPSPTTLSTETILLLPPLPPDNAQLRLINLLSNNGGCQIPCFWGISQNEFSINQAWNILNQLTNISIFTQTSDNSGMININYIEDEIVYKMWVKIYSLQESNYINYINFTAEAFKEVADPSCPACYSEEGIYNSTLFIEKLSYYMLQNIFTELGHPSSVLLNVQYGLLKAEYIGQMNIIIIYPENGIIILYKTPINISGHYILGCPKYSHIEMGLYPPGNEEGFYNELSVNWQTLISGFKELDNVTSLSAEEFYNIYKEPTEECIQTPLEDWPSVEY